MRKVFLSIMLLGQLKHTDYVSEDMEVAGKHYEFPVTYLLANNAGSGEKVTVITAVEHADGPVHTAEDNYELFKQEATQALQANQATAEFIEIPTTKDFDSMTFSAFFQNVADLLQDGDELYADITFGQKPYSIALFVALAYAVRAARGAELMQLIYSQRYTGSDIPNDKNVSCLYELTNLFYLNEVAATAKPGQKENLDLLLKLISSNT